VFSLLCVFAFCGTTSQAQIPIKARINYVVASQDIACPAGAPPAPTTSAFQALSDQLVDLKTKLTELQSNLRDLPGVTPETQQQVTAWLAAINSANPATPTTICAAASHLATVMSAPSTDMSSPSNVSAVAAIPASVPTAAPENTRPGGGVVSIEIANPAPLALAANPVAMPGTAPKPSQASHEAAATVATSATPSPGTSDTAATETTSRTAAGAPSGKVAAEGHGAEGGADEPAASDDDKKSWCSDSLKSPTSIVVAGAEYSGYSSEAQTTDGFFEMFYKSPDFKCASGWTRIRLTSAAQPATNGVVSVISNPTGLTTYNYSNVGQVLDFVAGPAWRIPKTKWALIGNFGAITPLSSQSAPVTYVAPAPGTQECATLLNRFSVKNGYNPGLTPNTSATPTTCIANGITDIAFSNQDRSNFFLKYGGGFRTWYPAVTCASSDSKCVPAYYAADLTLGQDSSVTGGQLRGVVFKIDGLFPIKTKNYSWLYLFGSAYIRLRTNQNLAPLLLQSPSSPISVPSPTVDVLPLVQPNRDYYRLGVGLNINQIWCQAFNSSCPKTSK
jgi:hypothetical protein